MMDQNPLIWRSVKQPELLCRESMVDGLSWVLVRFLEQQAEQVEELA
jgi:hypothetical protein